MLSREDGFTLAEVLVVMTMLVVVLFALHALFDATVRIMGVGEEELEAVQSARTGLEKMQREIRAAYPYDAAAGEDHLLWNTGDPTMGAVPAPDRISFGNDLDGDGRVGCPPAPSSACEVISYRLYRPAGSPSYALGRAKSRGGNLQPVVGNVSDADRNESKLLHHAQIVEPIPLLDNLAVPDAVDGDAFDLYLPASGRAKLHYLSSVGPTYRPAGDYLVPLGYLVLDAYLHVGEGGLVHGG